MSDVDTLIPFLTEDDLGDESDTDEGVPRKRAAGSDDEEDEGFVDDLIDPEGFGDEDEAEFDEEM